MDLYGRLLHDVLFPGFEAARGRPTMALLRYLDRTQWASRDELLAIQSGYLRRVMRHAFEHTDYYRRAFERAGLTPNDIRSPDDLRKFPVLDKNDARDTLEPRTSKAPPFATIHKGTSGSTGRPMTISYNAESRFWRDGTRWRAYGWAGYRPGMKAMHYWGFNPSPSKNPLVRLKIELDHLLKRDYYVDSTRSGDEKLGEAVAQFKSIKPDVIVAFGQSIAALSRYVNRTGARTWRHDTPVLTGAERVFPHDREEIERAFGPVFETYGAREVQLIGSECAAHEGLHTSMEMLIVEVVVREPDGSYRPAKVGETGEVCVTDLHNLAQPLIRYLIHDRAVERPVERCACGRWLHRVGPIEGRVSEALRDKQGNPVSGLLFSILALLLTKDTRQFQVHQHGDHRVTIRMIPVDAKNGLPKSLVDEIHSFCAKHLGVPTTIEVVDEIPVGPAGKLKVVIVDPPDAPAAARVAP